VDVVVHISQPAVQVAGLPVSAAALLCCVLQGARHVLLAEQLQQALR
jgi:hypothetical protein